MHTYTEATQCAPQCTVQACGDTYLYSVQKAEAEGSPQGQDPPEVHSETLFSKTKTKQTITTKKSQLRTAKGKLTSQNIARQKQLSSGSGLPTNPEPHWDCCVSRFGVCPFPGAMSLPSATLGVHSDAGMLSAYGDVGMPSAYSD